MLRDDIYMAIIVLSVMFYQLSGSKMNTLVSIIIITGFSYIYYSYYLSDKIAQEGIKSSDQNTGLQQEIIDRKETNMEIYNIKNFNTLKYVFNNGILIEIITNLRIIRMFDKGRYADLILLMEKYQKIYMYILGGRYDVKTYFDTFNDIGDKILELLYSLIFVIPESLKHVYGLDTTKLIDENTERFTALRRKMTTILENYGHMEVGEKYLPETLPYPANRRNEYSLP
jgi:hypothetical protein